MRKEVNRTFEKRNRVKSESLQKSMFNPETRDRISQEFIKALPAESQALYENGLRESLEIWSRHLQANLARKLSELGRLSIFARDRRYLNMAMRWKENVLSLTGDKEEFVCSLYDFLEDVKEWTAILQSKISTLRQTVKKGILAISRWVQTTLSSSRARSRRSPVRSAAKSSGDGNAGEDSDGSDPEPPKLKYHPLAALSLEGRRAA